MRSNQSVVASSSGALAGRGPTSRRCPDCQQRLSSKHNFCPECGRALVEMLERKQVTVLLADVCGSTKMIDGRDAESTRSIMDIPLKIISEPLDVYGGMVYQIQGDAIIALFGAPIAEENHALHACLAAIAIQRRAHSARLPKPILLRIGIHSGELVVGFSARHFVTQYSAIGNPMHCAKRIEEATTPGQIFISEATQRMVGDQVVTRSVGPHVLDGFDQSVVLHELDLVLPRSIAAPITRQRKWSPLFGRDAELQVLRDAGRAACRTDGRMQVVGIRGDPGIGKSRLLAELVGDADLSGFARCCVVARTYMARSPYSMVAALMTELLELPADLDNDGRLAAIEQVAEDWSEAGQKHLPALTVMLDLAPPDDDWRSLTPGRLRKRVSQALLWLIEQRLEDTPLFIHVEDIFLADADSQRLIGELLPRLEAARLLFCATSRLDFDRRWIDAPWFKEIWIQPLGEVDVRRQIVAILGDDESLAGLVPELVEWGDGNPFFVEQLAFSLIEDGTLADTRSGYRVQRPHAGFKVPPTVVTTVGTRVDRLKDAKASIEAAAILDEPVLAETVAAMQGIPVDRAHQHLQAGVDAGLLVAGRINPRTPGYSFRHALVRDAIASPLTQDRRRGLHDHAFIAICETLGAQVEVRASSLTQHAYAGERWKDAAVWALKSMARAVARSANREALRLFATGLAAVRRLADADQREPLEIALRLEAIGAFLPLGQIDEATGNLIEADAIAQRRDDLRCRATVSLQLAVVLWMRGAYTQGLVHALQAEEAGRRADRRHLQMTAAQVKMMMNHGLGRYQEALANARFTAREFELELATLQMGPGWATLPLVNLLTFTAGSLLYLGEVAESQQRCDEAYALLERTDHAYSRMLVDFAQGQIFLQRGCFDDAEPLLRAGVHSCEVNDIPTMFCCMVALLGGALARNGKAAEGLAMLQKAVDDKTYLAGGRYGEVFLRRHYAVALMQTGHHGEAVDAALLAVRCAEETEQHGHRAEALLDLAEILVAAGRPAQALVRLQEAVAQAEACAMPDLRDLAKERLHGLDGALWTSPLQTEGVVA